MKKKKTVKIEEIPTNINMIRHLVDNNKITGVDLA